MQLSADVGCAEVDFGMSAVVPAERADPLAVVADPEIRERVR